MALKTALLRRGDVLVIKSLDRLSRNKTDIKNELEYFKSNGIRLKVLDLPTTLIDCPNGQEWVWDMVFNILVEVYYCTGGTGNHTRKANRGDKDSKS